MTTNNVAFRQVQTHINLCSLLLSLEIPNAIRSVATDRMAFGISNSHRIFKRLAKALIRLRLCAGWSKPLLVAHTTLLEISCGGSNALICHTTSNICIHICEFDVGHE